MKVVSAEVIVLQLGEANQYGPRGWHPVLLKLKTDEGIIGLGEAGLAYGVGARGAAGMIHDLVEAFVIGRDPLDREALWNDLHRRTFWGGVTSPVFNGAMSAIDIALWDIWGKVAGQPIYKLLGGKVNQDLRCYASQLQAGWEGKMLKMVEPEQYADAARKALAEGYDAIKVDPLMVNEAGSNEIQHRLKGALDSTLLKRVVARMEAIRGALGPDPDIILELHSLTSLTGAVQIYRACEHLNLFMMEEAVNYGSDRVARTLRDRLPDARLTGGERIFTRWGFRGYLEDGAFDMIQPDFCLVGGITEGRKICDMAHAYEVTVQGHVCGSPISTAAALHIETAIPNFQIHEHHVIATVDYNRHICVQELQPVNGRYTAPDAPGLGVDLNDDFVRKNAIVVEVGR
jgi:galactonate dehydratase